MIYNNPMNIILDLQCQTQTTQTTKFDNLLQSLNYNCATIVLSGLFSNILYNKNAYFFSM